MVRVRRVGGRRREAGSDGAGSRTGGNDKAAGTYQAFGHRGRGDVPQKTVSLRTYRTYAEEYRCDFFRSVVPSTCVKGISLPGENSDLMRETPRRISLRKSRTPGASASPPVPVSKFSMNPPTLHAPRSTSGEPSSAAAAPGSTSRAPASVNRVPPSLNGDSRRVELASRRMPGGSRGPDRGTRDAHRDSLRTARTSPHPDRGSLRRHRGPLRSDRGSRLR